MPDKADLRVEIELLSEMERGEITSQLSLAQRISVSVGLLNALLKRAVQKGFVKIQAAPYKRYAYYITPKGFAEKSRLVAEYLEVSLGFFRRAKEEYVGLLTWALARNGRRFILIGRGELAEIALLAAREVNAEILGLFDRTVNAKQLYGMPVLPSIDDLTEADVLVITASRNSQEAFDEVRSRFPRQLVLAPACLHVVVDPLKRIGEGQPERVALSGGVPKTPHGPLALSGIVVRGDEVAHLND